GRLERGIHDVARESPQYGAAGNQATQGSRIVRVVIADHLAAGSARSDVDERLVLLGQFVVGLVIDIQRNLSGTFPPARIVVILGHFLEAELFIVDGTNKFDGVQRTLFKRGIN